MAQTPAFSETTGPGAADQEIKTCPECGRPNLPEKMECWQCGADISGVAPMPIVPVFPASCAPVLAGNPAAVPARSGKPVYWAAGVGLAALVGCLVAMAMAQKAPGIKGKAAPAGKPVLGLPAGHR